MKSLKFLVVVAAMAVSPLSLGQDLKLGDSFVGDFTIDSSQRLTASIIT